MKRLFTPLFFAIALILFGACRSFEGGNVAVRPAIMEVHGDSVYYNAHVSVPERSGIRTRTEYRISPVLAAHRFDTMEVYSDECVDLNEVGVDSNFRYSARFDESMMGNYLNAEHWYKRKGRKRTFPQMEKLAYCCVRSGDLLSSDDKYLISESYYGGDPTPIKLVGQFNFPRGVYEFDISTLSEKDINTVMTFLHMKASPATLEISAYASPEGDMAYNKMLSKNRAREVKNWVQEETNKLPAGTMKGKTIKTNAYGEDWTGFRQKIKDSDLSSDKKNKIIKIIDSNKHPEQKEKEIRALAGDLNTLEPYLAPLRRTNIVIAGQRAARTPAEIDSIANAYLRDKEKVKIKEAFTQEEWLEAATRTHGTEGKKTLLLAYYQVYPEDYRVTNNLGVMEAQANINNAEEAEAYFKKSITVNAGDFTAYNNLGVLYSNMKRYQEAEENFKKALEIKDLPEIHYNFGLMYSRAGNYSNAIHQFNSAEDVEGRKLNRGIAKLLLKEYPDAETDLKSHLEEFPEDARAYYALAVLGARQGNQQMVTENLDRACGLEPDFCEKARADAEFRNYEANPEFQNVTVRK